MYTNVHVGYFFHLLLSRKFESGMTYVMDTQIGVLIYSIAHSIELICFINEKSKLDEFSNINKLYLSSFHWKVVAIWFTKKKTTIKKTTRQKGKLKRILMTEWLKKRTRRFIHLKTSNKMIRILFWAVVVFVFFFFLRVMIWKIAVVNLE